MGILIAALLGFVVGWVFHDWTHNCDPTKDRR